MRKKKKTPTSPVKRKSKWDDDRSKLVFRSVHMISLLVLLNRGRSPEELMSFNDDFNTVLSDVCSGHLSFADIIDTIKEETGLTLADLQWEE
jgi:hypothetical protein